MRVAVDITPMLGVGTGVARFTREVVGRLASRPELSIVGLAVTWRGRGTRPDGLPASVPLTGRPMLPLPARPVHTLWARVAWPPVEWWTGPVDVVHGTNYVVPPARRATGLATVHDLTMFLHPELAEPTSRRFPPLVRAAIGRGAHVHTVSRFVADELIAFFAPRLPAERVHVVPNGVTGVGGGEPARARALVGSAPFVLALGAVEPRKQMPLLVRAFDAVAALHGDVRLVVAGPDGWGVDEFDAAVAAAVSGRRIIRLGWVDEGTRADLLAGASLLAFPSLYEGFGLPPLEAMSAGTPVVATRAGAIPEVVGDAAVLVDPSDADELASAIDRLLTDDALRRDLIALGRDRVGQFTWDRTAAELAAVYAELARSA
jgi:glycosyltransferase involved in cell wall biosynthesis